MSGDYVLIDANDAQIDWDAISKKVSGWKISVGTLHPIDTDEIGGEITKEDVELLSDRARFLISDTKRCEDLALSFLFITREDDIDEWINQHLSQ